jgi:hypothetical protein
MRQLNQFQGQQYQQMNLNFNMNMLMAPFGYYPQNNFGLPFLTPNMFTMMGGNLGNGGMIPAMNGFQMGPAQGFY